MSITSQPFRRYRYPFTGLLLSALLGLCLLIHHGQLQAGEQLPLSLNGDPDAYAFILPHSRVIADPDASLSAAQIFSGRALAATPITRTSFNGEPGVYWFQFTLRNNSDTTQRYWLNIGIPTLDHVDLYKRGAGDTPLSTGLLAINPAWEAWEVPHVLPVDMQPNETADYLLQIEHHRGFNFAPKLHANHSYITHNSGFNIRLGLIYGVLFTLFVFALNLYFSLRNKLFIYYLIYLAALALQTTWLQGSIKQLFPGNLLIADTVSAVGSVAGLLANAFFTRYFLLLPQKNAFLDKAVVATGIVPLILIVAVPLSTTFYDRMILVLVMTALVINIIASIYRLAQHYSPAIFILIGNLVVFTPLFLLLLLPESVLPQFTNANIYYPASIIKALVLGCGLSALVDNLNKTLFREISKRKSRESQLMHAQQIARYGDWSWDTRTNQFEFSESALDVLPTLADGVENDFDKLLKRATSRQRRKMRAAFGNAAKEKQGFDTEFSLLHDDGSTHYYLTRAEFQRNDNGQITPILIGTIHDITDSKLADLAYRENEQRWRELADSTFESILIYQDDIIIDANQACEQLLGFSPTELIGSSGEAIASKENLPSLLSAIRDAANSPIELTLTDKWGENTDVEFRSRTGMFNQQPVQIVAIRDISERKLHEQQLVKLGYYDNLTGLANRTLFQERLQHAINKSQRYAQTHALLFIDLDQFKHVNDSLGHDVGDRLLVEVGRRLKGRVRKEDTVARFGGDEFAVLVEDITAPYAAAKVAEEIIKVMSEHIEVDEYQLMVTPSIGIAIYPSDGNTGGELLRKADTAMYHAKNQGRNNYQFYTEELNEKMVRRMDLESELRLAVNNDDFALHFQPKIDLRSGDIVGAEALLRWHSDKFGMVSPDEFIGIAEETGLIWPIGELALEHACRQAAEWLNIYPAFASVAVNISGVQFNHSNLVETVAAVIEKTGLPPHYLELEITEGAIIDNAEEAIAVMNRLKALGVKLSLDDFGTGYSSLNYLKRFPVDSLKIDRSFIAEIVDDKTGQLIADNIVRLAHALQLKIVAEGVETVEQLNMIRDMGCDELQGYIFSRPLPNRDFETMLGKNSNLYRDKLATPSAGNL